MQIGFIDWLLLATYFLIAIAIGVYYSGRAGKSISEFFASGGNLPWWIAGTSMVATTFAADTPLAVTELVANHGIAGNWLWWNMVMSGLLTVFLYARLWRRAGILTDIEFTELRYSGKQAAVLRGFRAIYLAVPVNLIIMGWVNLALVTVIELTLGINKLLALGICLAVTMAYSFLSGLWGVVMTDFLQFFVAMIGSILLAVFAVRAVGGIDAMKTGLVDMYGSEVLNFAPDIGAAWMPVSAFVVYLAVNWWATWYPGAEPGGGGYIAQRMFATKDERHSFLATLWFNVAHYALRPWPWILVALVSMLLYPELSAGEKRTGYILVMLNQLPPGVKGLLLASFAAAYMSTMSTHLNWGSSYIVNDFYKRFIKKDAPPEHYVAVGRWSIVGLVAASAVVTTQMQTISGAWKFLLALGAGTGAVYILRWFWWRINAWSEISGMASSFIVASFLYVVVGVDTSNLSTFAWVMITNVIITTVVWLTVTFLTAPEPMETLTAFYRRVHPGGGLWKPVAVNAPEVKPDAHIGWDILDWLLGVVLVYSALFGIGRLILEEYRPAAILLTIGAACFIFIMWDLKRRGWKTFEG